MPSPKLLLTALAALLIATPGAAATTRDVLYVGNNWDGTADVVDPYDFSKLAHLDIVPDKEERLAEIQADPAAQGYFLAVREAVGEGHDQYVDDIFSSHDGRFLYVSRPSFADVVGFDLSSRKIIWRFKVDGYRADHMGISPDGTKLLVSASTARKVHVLDPATGRAIGSFESGDQPHENNFSADGNTIFHASIGSVFTPTDDPALDHTKGDRWFEIVDARTLKVTRRLDMGQKLAEAGYPGMSSAVRPMALSPDERFVYFQVSFFHGFVEYDLVQDKVLRIARLPISDEAAKKRREEYLLDSAHHGLAMNPEGTKLCVAGTMSDYAAITHRDSFATKIAANGQKPYWATNSGDGRYCFVSFSGDDAVSVISYADEREVARIGVGDHPQRMRMGTLEVGLLGTGAPSPRSRAEATPRLYAKVSRRRVRARTPVRFTVTVTSRRDGRAVPVKGARVLVGGLRARTNAKGRASLRKRHGFERVRRYRVVATRTGYRPAAASLRSLRPRR